MRCFYRLLLAALVFLFALMLASYCSIAQAQAVQPKCLPFGLDGQATTFAPFVKRTDLGWHIWLYCRDPYVGIVAQGMTCPHGECIAFDQAVERTRQALNGGAQGLRDLIAAVTQPERACSRTDLPEPWPALCDEMRALMRADMPQEPKPVWRVAPNSTYATRPAYPISAGVRGTISNGRATVGAECDCAVRSVEGSSVYCGVNGRADQVALCRRAQ